MERIYFNDDWYFTPEYKADLLAEGVDEATMDKVRLPHTCKEVPFHYFDESEYQMVVGYLKHIYAPAKWEGKRLLLTVDGAAHVAELYLNGKLLASHSCGYTAFTVDLTQEMKIGEDNVLVIKVDSNETANVPPFGFVVDYMTFGGLTREVYLDVKEQCYISDAFYRSEFVAQDLHCPTLRSTVQMEGISSLDGMCIRQYLIEDENEKLLFEGEVKKTVEIQSQLKDIVLWDVENPKLYTIETRLYEGSTCVDVHRSRFGFRKAEFLKDGFYLNGKKLKIRGLNRHQSYPYVGYAMPQSMQELDADILKNELGLNAVRTSHYPQSHYFIDRCDEIGLLVFMEFPGWQHIGDAKWKDQALVNLREMITQYRNHSSIILWGVRINESKDDDEFYLRTNKLAHELDDSRQTGGVRAHKKSHLFEDVYTYNDFVHDGTNNGCEPKSKVTSDMEKGYLISEYNGHMYPTKAFDWEEHRVTHALRHAKVLDGVAKEEDIAGSFGWCMFDYNTHKDFGSGDRICYHGVMDMFRNPKLAALIYSCQQDKIPVLELSSTMDIGEHPGCNRGFTYIISNADSVRMYKNDVFIKEYTSEQSPYENLKHGPILVDDFIGDEIHKNENFKKKQADMVKEGLNYVTLHGYHFPPHIIALGLKCMLFYHMKPDQAITLYNKYIGDWGGTSTVYRFEAIKDGKVVKTITKAPMKSMHMEAIASSSNLKEKTTYDVAEIRIRMLDENNNQLYFYNEPIQIETEGPIEVIGPKLISFAGGMTGVYIKTTGQAGQAKVILNSPQGEKEEISFSVEA